MRGVPLLVQASVALGERRECVARRATLLAHRDERAEQARVDERAVRIVRGSQLLDETRTISSRLVRGTLDDRRGLVPLAPDGLEECFVRTFPDRLDLRAISSLVLVERRGVCDVGRDHPLAHLLDRVTLDLEPQALGRLVALVAVIDSQKSPSLVPALPEVQKHSSSPLCEKPADTARSPADVRYSFEAQ